MATMKRACIIAFLFLIPALAKADSVWTYQGNGPFASNAPGEGFTLTGTVLLNNNDQAIAWDFVAGPDVFTNFNSTGTINPFACTNCTKPFSYWFIMLDDPTGLSPVGAGTHLISFSAGAGFVPPVYGNLTAFDIAWNDDGSFGQVVTPNNPGVWTAVVSTPEPGSLLLLGAGIAALALTISLQKLRGA